MRIPHQAVAAGLLIHLASLHYIFSSTSIVGDSVVVRDSTVVVKAGTTPLAVFWSLAGILLYFTLLSQKQESISVGTPSWWRRVAAFLLDFYYSLFVIAGIWALVPLGLEASRTGHFAWQFERHYTVPTDFNDVPAVFVLMGLMFCTVVLVEYR